MSDDNGNRNLPPRIVFSNSTINAHENVEDDGREAGVHNGTSRNPSLPLGSSHEDTWAQLDSSSIHSAVSHRSRQKRHSNDSQYKRLSIFSNATDASKEEGVMHKITNLSKRKNKGRGGAREQKYANITESGNEEDRHHGTVAGRGDKVDPQRQYRSKKKPPKLVIPDSSDMGGLSPPSSARSPVFDLSDSSSIPKTPTVYKKREDIENDFTSALDDALLSSAWMPTMKQAKTLKVPKQSTGSSHSSILINRKRKSLKDSQLSFTSSFNNDLEANGSIPLKNLNFTVPTIQVDTYMEGSNTSNPEIHNISNRNSIISTVDLSYTSDPDISSNNLARKASNISTNRNTIHKGPTIRKIFAKMSNIVNADSPDVEDDYLSDSDSDSDNSISNEDDASHLSDISLNTQHIKSSRNSMLNKAITTENDSDNESLFNYYMDEFQQDHQRNNLSNDVISVLSSQRNSLNPTDSSHTENETQLQSKPLFQKLLDKRDNHTPLLFGKTLKIFGPDSRLRKLCYAALMHPLTNQLLTILLISQVAIMSYQQWSVDRMYSHNHRFTWPDWVVFVFYIVYTVEMFLKIITFGLYDDSQMLHALKIQRYQNELQNFYEKTYENIKSLKIFKNIDPFKTEVKDAKLNPFDDSNAIPTDTDSNDVNSKTSEERGKEEAENLFLKENRNKNELRYAYLRTDWNRIDFVSIISFWIAFFLSLNYKDIQKVQLFRSLMCFRILRLLNVSRGSRRILRGLKEATVQSKEVFIFLIFFWIFFSIIGVQTFESSFRRHCVWTNPDDPTDIFENEFQFCGSYLDPTTLKILPFINEYNLSSHTAKGYACPVNSKCILIENPYNGRVSFDNIVQSMQSVFVIMSANTFTDLMYYTMDSDSMAASLFFIFGIFVLMVWLINLFVAVIIHSFKNEDHLRKKKISWFEAKRKMYSKFVKNSKIIQNYGKFEVIFVILIFSTFIFSCTKTRQNGVFPSKYNTVEFVVSIVLMVEILVRFGIFTYAQNWRAFFFSGFNLLDLFLNMFALIFSLPPVYNSISSRGSGWLSVFGILRFYRVIVFIKPIRKSWGVALKRTRPFVELILFGIMLIYSMGLIMSRLFEGVVPESELSENPWVMYDLPNCIVSLFIILTTENWTDVLYTAEQYANSTFNCMCFAVYLIGWFLLANTVIWSICIAIITDNLELSEAEKKINQIKQFVKSCIENTQNNSQDGLFDMMKNKFEKSIDSEEASNFIDRMNELLISNGHDPIDVKNYKENDDNGLLSNVRNILNDIAESAYLKDIGPYLQQWKQNLITTYYKITPFNAAKQKNSPTVETALRDHYGDSDNAFVTEHATFLDQKQEKKKEKVDRSLLIFTNDNPIRRFCQIFVSPNSIKRTEGRQPAPKTMYLFNVVMFLSSVVVVILACYETPLYRKDHGNGYIYNSWTIYSDVVFMVMFTVEFLIKIIADGFIFGPRAYIKSAWNKFDFVVLISFWVTVLSIVTGNYSLIVTFSALKAFRAFRLLTITKESQMIFHFAIISGAIKIISAAMVSLSLLIPFALWGLNIFSQELSTCSDGESTIFNCSLEYTNEVFNWEIVSPNVVQTPYLQFNTFSNSFRSLFEILSLEGWVDLLGNVVNITEYGQPSDLFASPGNGAFVIIFIFIATIFIINLFISIIINNYSIQTGVAFLNNEQYGWYEVKKVLSRVRPSKRRDIGEMSNIQRKIYNAISNTKSAWSRYIRCILVVHILVLLSESYPDSADGEVIRSSFYLLTTSSLFVHLVLLQFTLGFRVFYSNKFNILVTIITLAAFLMTCLSFHYTSKTAFYNIRKVFLVAVLFFIIPQIDILNQLVKYGSAGFFSFLALIYTWLVLFLVFAIALNQLFGLTRLGPNTTGNLNLRTVTKALIMLFRNSFGEGWNYIMVDFELAAPYCFTDNAGHSDCGNKVLAEMLFIIWNILSMYIFLNILVSVVINNFSYVYHGSGPHKLITREEIRKFKRAWNRFDINGMGFIYERDLYNFLHSLDGVLSYHVYPKYISLPVLMDKVISNKNPVNGYDFQIDSTKLEEMLSLIDFNKVRHRRMRYQRLISELLASAIVINVDDFENDITVVRKIAFSEALLVIGYYSRFEDSTCLNLADFLRHSTQVRQINRELRKAKVLATIKTIFTRLRYKYAVDKCDIFNKIKHAPTAMQRESLREELRESLTGANFSFDQLMERLNEVDEENPVFNQNLYRVMSQGSNNPFSDVHNIEAYDDMESFVSSDSFDRK